MNVFAADVWPCLLSVVVSMSAGALLLAACLAAIPSCGAFARMTRILRGLFRPSLSALMAWLCVVPLMCSLIVHGSEKRCGGTAGSPALLLIGDAHTASLITPEDIERGYRLSADPEDTGFAPLPVGTTTNALLLLRGGFDWAFRIGRDDWRFPYGDGVVSGVTVSARGEIRPTARARPLPRLTDEDVSLLPEAMWRLLPDGGPSLFRHAFTERGSLVLDWRNALVGRSLSSPTNMQAELFGDGSFVWRTDGATSRYLPVFPFDWDGDGLANAVDPEPFVPHTVEVRGTDDEWYRVVCSNLFEVADGSLRWREGVNQGAYYFVDVVAAESLAPVIFTADCDSSLGSPAVVVRVGETNRVPLLIGVEYAVTSTVPFSVSLPKDGFAEIVRHGAQGCTVKWPLDFAFLETVSPQGRSYAVSVTPFDPGGVFAWDSSESSRARSVSGVGGTCRCWSGDGRVVSCSCSETCVCGGGCTATGEYVLESARFAVSGNVCRCGLSDSEPSPEPDPESPDEPPLSVSFSNGAVIFEDAYLDYDGSHPKRSTRVTLTVSAHGGEKGGRLTLECKGLDRLSPVACGPMVLPPSMELAPGESYFATFVCEGAEESEAKDDVEVTGVLVENETGVGSTDEAKLTVVRVELLATVDPPDHNAYGYANRHRYGVCETVKILQKPDNPGVFWNPIGGGSNGVDKLSGPLYFCPLHGHQSPLQAECGNATYRPQLTIVEPQSIKAELLHDYTWGSIVTGSAGKGKAGGIGMLLQFYVRPFYVSFAGISVQEVVCSSYMVDGYFKNPYFSHGFGHSAIMGAGTWHEVGVHNEMSGYDTVSYDDVIPWLKPDGAISNAPAYAWTAGDIVINNPFGWSYKGCPPEASPYKLFATDTVTEVALSPDGTVGVRKLRNQVQRTTNDVIHLNLRLMNR